ncbi:MAG: Signal peptidase I [candidate division TM6 bacterium GW2011_GWF2_43_17]|nr:MAG: Signal peptidase I [candidate division TM6 bacterium GW2011_GWF2_43_17]HAU30023.1 signal peptidase I [Candidatus Dependentiae bacterium]
MFRRINAWMDRQNFLVQITVILLFVFAIRTFLVGLYLVPTGSMEPTMLVGERFVADKLTPFFREFQRGEIIAFDNPNFEYSSNPLKFLFQQYVWGPDNWTKRVVGLPGERVQGKIEDGKPVIYINGKKLDEPYVNPYPLIYVRDRKGGPYEISRRTFDPAKGLGNQPFYKIDPADLLPSSYDSLLYAGTPQSYDEFDFTLGADEYWVMGDNREGSHDCRSWGKDAKGMPLKRSLIHGRIFFRILSIDSQEGWLLLDMIKHPISFWSKVRWSRCLNIVR